MKGSIFIHATNVHQGGGRSLLGALLKAVQGKAVFKLSLDERMPIPANMEQEIEVNRVRPSILSRLNAERWLAKSVNQDDVVLCFGSLPPLFKLRGHTVVFVQNRYLIDQSKLSGFKLYVQIRLTVERLWLSTVMSNVNTFVVQTASMKRLMEIKTRGKVPVLVLPFVEDQNSYFRSLSKHRVLKKSKFDFVYVATGEPHKNHCRLLEAWCLLAEEGIFPSLCLTLDESRFSGLCRQIDVMRKQYKVEIINVGELSHEDVISLYKEARAMIYPSTFESFGLPLIEARQAGLSVLASELDYVHDVLDPEQVFDPYSTISIARAVKRFEGIEELPLTLLDASQFLFLLFQKDMK